MPKISLFSALASLLVLAAISITAVQSAHAVVESTCAVTLYPDLCVSTINEAALSPTSIESSKDVLLTALSSPIYSVERNYFTIKKIGASRRNSPSWGEKSALHDCLELAALTLEHLRVCELELKDYGLKNYSLTDHKDNLMTYLSAAQTNQETCLDGFSNDEADKKLRQALVADHEHIFRLLSNVLAIIKNLSGTEIREDSSFLRKFEDSGEDEWPEWLSEEDRRVLQAAVVVHNVTVAKDGSGNYTTVGEAVAAAPRNSNERYVIKIKEGVYSENVTIPSEKSNLMFVGDGRTTTIITGDRSNASGWSTFRTATVAVVGTGFLARDIQFRNTAGPSGNQSVALRVNADKAAFYRCSMIAYQDTLYVHSCRQFYTHCFISGTIDFIFGDSAAVLQYCDIRARRPNPGQRNMVTAQGRSDPNQNTGIVIQKCKISADYDLRPVLDEFPTYLGRPWRSFSRTIVMQNEISNVIHPAGWYRWDNNISTLKTLFYAEYQNTGEGADTANRVTWEGFHVFTSAAEAEPFTAEKFIKGRVWLPNTTFPFLLGL